MPEQSRNPVETGNDEAGKRPRGRPKTSPEQKEAKRVARYERARLRRLKEREERLKRSPSPAAKTPAKKKNKASSTKTSAKKPDAGEKKERPVAVAKKESDAAAAIQRALKTDPDMKMIGDIQDSMKERADTKKTSKSFIKPTYKTLPKKPETVKLVAAPKATPKSVAAPKAKPRPVEVPQPKQPAKVIAKTKPETVKSVAAPKAKISEKVEKPAETPAETRKGAVVKEAAAAPAKKKRPARPNTMWEEGQKSLRKGVGVIVEENLSGKAADEIRHGAGSGASGMDSRQANALLKQAREQNKKRVRVGKIHIESIQRCTLCPAHELALGQFRDASQDEISKPAGVCVHSSMAQEYPEGRAVSQEQSQDFPAWCPLVDLVVDLDALSVSMKSGKKASGSSNGKKATSSKGQRGDDQQKGGTPPAQDLKPVILAKSLLV